MCWMEGYEILYRDSIMAPAKLLSWDPCSLGSPETWTGAHMARSTASVHDVQHNTGTRTIAI